MNKTLIQEAFDMFEPIPENEWITGNYSNSTGTKCCAVGHYIRLKLDKSAKDIFSMADWVAGVAGELRKETKKFLYETYKNRNGDDITNVNNGKSRAYPQSTPKARVMALLQDMLNT